MSYVLQQHVIIAQHKGTFRLNTKLNAGFKSSSSDKSKKQAKTRTKAGKAEKSAVAGQMKDNLSKLTPSSNIIDKFCPTLDLNMYSSARCVHNDPLVFEIDNFLATSVCDRMMGDADTKGVSVHSRTFSSATTAARTSTTWYMAYQDVPEFLSAANALTGIPMENYEEPQIVRYEMGQQFSWHCDAIPTSLLHDGMGGQRRATLLVYLNSPELGGATSFRQLGIEVTPKQGKALLFFPSDKHGNPDDRTEHAGTPAFDTKYIAQVWMHQRAYTPTLGPPGSSALL